MRALLRRAHDDGVGKRYLIQHSAGSGKSNTIAWLAHQLVERRRKDDPMTAQAAPDRNVMKAWLAEGVEQP